MKISLSDMTIKDKKVQGYLLAYLDKMSRFEHFDSQMLLQVFLTSDNDFSAFEAKDYRLQFTSSAHKLSETIKSNNILDSVRYLDFVKRVRQIQLDTATA